MKISIIDQIKNCVRFIKTNTYDRIISGSFDRISCTGCGTFVTSKDTNYALSNVVLCDALGFRCITFAVLSFHQFKVCSFKSGTESFFSVYTGISSCIYIDDTNLSGCYACIFQSLEHFFACCFSGCFIIC